MKLKEVVALFLCLIGASGLAALVMPVVAKWLVGAIPADTPWQILGIAVLMIALLVSVIVGWVVTYFLAKPVLRLR